MAKIWQHNCGVIDSVQLLIASHPGSGSFIMHCMSFHSESVSKVPPMTSDAPAAGPEYTFGMSTLMYLSCSTAVIHQRVMFGDTVQSGNVPGSIAHRSSRRSRQNCFSTTAQMRFLATPVIEGDPGGPMIDHMAFHTRALVVLKLIIQKHVVHLSVFRTLAWSGPVGCLYPKHCGHTRGCHGSC